MDNDGDQTFDADVAIIGYGPVGMTLAILTALNGFKVCVYERHPARWGSPRHGHMDGQIMRIMQDIGIAADVEKIARAVTEFEIRSAQGDTLQSLSTSESTGGGWKSAYLVYSPEFEDLLDTRARNLGVRVEMGHEVVRIEQDERSVDVTACSAADRSDTHTRRVRFVVGCDGARSFVRKHLGIERTEMPFPHPAHLVLDFEHTDPDHEIPGLEVNTHILSPDRWCIFGRWNGGRWSRWEFACRDDETAAELNDRDRCWELLAPWNLGPKDGTIVRHAVYSFQARIAETWQSNRVFLAGDAAHTMPPFLGQGMNSGVRDAANLAWKLSAVLNNISGPEILKTYQMERAPHMEKLTRMSIALGTVIENASKQQSESGLQDHFTQAPPFPKLSNSCLFGQDGADCIGTPMLQARVLHRGRVALLGDFIPFGWTLITRRHLPDGAWMPRHRDLLAKYRVTVAHVSRGSSAAYIDLDGIYDVWYRTQGRKAVLVRPDHYVFGAVEHALDAPDLVLQLGTAMESFSL